MSCSAVDLTELQAVIFDFDGVILDSAPVKEQAFLDLFADYPEHRESIREHHRQFLGVSRFNKFEWIFANLLGRPLTGVAKEQLGRRFSELVMKQTLSCPLVAGAERLLDSLAGRLPLFVASATPQDELDRIVEKRKLKAFFTAVHGWPPAKEDLLARILDAGGFEAERVLMIGDGMSDLHAAEVVGCQFIGRVDDRLPTQAFPEAVHCVRSLEEVEARLC